MTTPFGYDITEENQTLIHQVVQTRASSPDAAGTGGALRH